MTAKKRQTKQEERSTATDYLKKAQDSYETMLIALHNKNYNAVGTHA